MNLNIHATTLASLQRQVSVLGFICIGMAVSLVFAVGSLVSTHDRIVVVPPGLSGPTAVDWGKADTEYLKAFGVFYSTLLGTITPRNAEYVADRLTAMTEPAAYAEIRKSILALAKDPSFSSSGATANFVSNQVVYEPETGKVFVLGENQVYAGSGQPKKNPVVYEMDIRIVEGRPVVKSVTNYNGIHARTLEWKTNNPGWDKPKQQQG